MHCTNGNVYIANASMSCKLNNVTVFQYKICGGEVCCESDVSNSIQLDGRQQLFDLNFKSRQAAAVSRADVLISINFLIQRQEARSIKKQWSAGGK